jgi:hypothetical protein
MLTCSARRALTALAALAAVAAAPAFSFAQDGPGGDPDTSTDLAPGGETSPALVPGNLMRRTPTLAPVSPSSPTKTVLSLNAFFFEGSPTINSGLHWRIFSDQPDVNGNHALVHETMDPRPLVTLDPGGYICHVVYGLVGATRHVVLGAVATTEHIVLNAGAISFSGTVAGKTIAGQDLQFEVHRTGSSADELVGEAKSGEILRLPAGSYQVTSTYGTANAKVISEVRVESGKLTEAAVLHKAGIVDLRLQNAQGEQVEGANWSILTPGGDVVTETVSDFHNIVLAEGEYVAVARYEGKIIQKQFEVVSGQTERVDLAQG